MEQLEEASKDWKEGNTTSNSNNGRKEDPRNYRLVSLTSIPAKVIEHVILEMISRHIKDKKVTGSNKNGEILLNQPDNLL